MNETVSITLSHDEALVLFEFLSRFSDEQKLEIKHQAEQRVLWNMLCALEPVLVEPFRSDYLDVLQKARNKVRDKK